MSSIGMQIQTLCLRVCFNERLKACLQSRTHSCVEIESSGRTIEGGCCEELCLAAHSVLDEEGCEGPHKSPEQGRTDDQSQLKRGKMGAPASVVYSLGCPNGRYLQLLSACAKPSFANCR
jgi:hypothetical protein